MVLFDTRDILAINIATPLQLTICGPALSWRAA